MITTLSQLVAMAESNNNPGATRFERAFKPSPLGVARCQVYNLAPFSPNFICATSYGKYQIMGEELYRRGLISCAIAEYQTDPDMQDETFLDFIKEKGIAYTLEDILNDDAKRYDFAHHYNGSPIVYGNYLLKVYAENS